MISALSKSSFTILLIIHYSFLTILCSPSRAQVPTVQDCLGAIRICQDVYVEHNSYSGSGNFPNEIYNPAGDCMQDCPGSCLDGEQNSVWYMITIQNDGYLRFTIDPAGDDDYDWALYDLTTYSCSDIYYDYNLIQKSCNAYGQSPNGNTGISTANGGTTDCNHCGGSGSSRWNADIWVTEGSVFVIVVENWSGTNNGFAIDFSDSMAGVTDNKPPEIDTVFTGDIGCGAMQIMVGFSEKVMCESVGPSDFLFTGPGGPFMILDVQGNNCMEGGEMEKQYTLLLDSPINTNGDYTLMLVPENSVYDGCNNVATGDTIVFYLDPGVPVVIDSGIVITGANYGENNGQITGLIVNGNGPFSYLWYDQFNDTISTGLELNNVYSGNYFFKVTDTNSCEALAGPYYVDLIDGLPAEQENRSGNISIFPNPTHGVFTILSDKDVVSISLFNLVGNILYSFDNEEIKSGTLILDLSGNGRGVYLVKATFNSGNVVTRRVQVL
jgi:hypothetical protein